MGLYSFSAMKGSELRALDGDMGSVRDFLFEDDEWNIRYLVADTGVWLPGRKVLLSPAALQDPDWSSGTIPVDLTRERIKNSPDISTDQPVSQQMQANLAAYYGWPFLPTYPYMPAGGFVPPPITDVGNLTVAPEPPREGPQLRSGQEVIGYAIMAQDGEIGDVKDFIIDTANWKISLVIVDTGRWLPGRKVLLSARNMRHISWNTRSLSVDLTREQVQGSPEYDPKTPVNVEYEKRVLDYYGRPRS